MAGGIMLGIGYTFPDHSRYKKLSANGKPDPEARLPPAMVDAVTIPISIFWFA